MVSRVIDLEPAQIGASPLRDHDEWPEHAIQILLQVADSMTPADGVQQALGRLASLGLSATGADRCAIFVRDASGRTLLPTAASSKIGGGSVQWRKFQAMGPIEIDGDPAREALWATANAVTLDDATASELIPEPWKKAWASRSLAFAPLRAGGEAYGLLVVDYVGQDHSFTRGEARLLDAIAAAAGAALRSARLVEAMHRSIEIERRLVECGTAVQSGRSLNEVLDLIAGSFTFLLRGKSCSINLLSTDHEGFTAVAHRGPQWRTGEVTIHDLPAADVAAIRAMWAGDPHRPIVIPDVSVLRDWAGVVPSGIGPALLVALWDGKDILGFVAIGRERDAFTDEEARVACAFSDQAALAVAKARMNDSLQARLGVIEALHRLSAAVIGTSDLKRVLGSLNRGVGQDNGVECVRVGFKDELLTRLLGLKPLSREDLSLLRSWHGPDDLTPIVRGDKLLVPIPMNARIAGVLWMRQRRPLDSTGFEFVRAIAGGLGEVAYKAKLRRTAERRSQELVLAAERERIARDLHDTVGQTFFGIGLKLEDVLRDVTDPALAGRLGELRHLSAQAVADVRSAVYALSFLHVRSHGLLASMRKLMVQFSGATGVMADFRSEGRLPRLSEEAESALFRVAHEALVNVDRHARATGVVLSILARGDVIELTIRDDGVGLDQRQVSDWQSAAHFGMRTMERVVRSAGGTFRVLKPDPRGLVIEAVVPIRSGLHTNKR